MSCKSKLLPAVFLYAFCLALSACGGGGGSSSGDTNDDVLTGGKILVDGHLINPEFFTPGEDFYVNVSYFDQNGRLTSYHQVYEWEGTEPTFADDYRYTYNGNGDIDIVDEEFTYTREGLALYNHVFDQTTYEYSGGRLVSETTRKVKADFNADGVYDEVLAGEIKRTISYSYDGNGNLSTIENDFGGNKDLTTFEYDLNGNLVKETFDNLPLRMDIKVNEFDSNGNKIKQTLYKSEIELAAGEKSSVTDYFYNARGDIIREEIDHGVANQSSVAPDGTADIIIRYVFGNNGELTEKSTETFFLSSTRRDVIKYLHEAIDSDSNGEPDVSIVYVFWLDTVTDTGGGYPAEALPDWYSGAQSNLNNGDDDDGWGLNWDGHDTGTCSTCGNMIGEVTSILLGF